MKPNPRMPIMLEELPVYEDFFDFCTWYENLFPDDILDLQEAATIYFNLETYTI
jgi:hypothetical protein